MTKPMFAWAGGKQKLLKHYLPYFPEQHIKTYSEPFFGGGAMFTYVVERYNPKVAYLNDINGEIIGIYRAVRDHLGDFIKLLQVYENQYLPLCPDGRKSYYYQLRDRNKLDYRSWSEVEQAAAQFVLLKTCYRGL